MTLSTGSGIGSRLRAARLARGMTQSALAGSDYSVAYVSRIESGERTPSPEALAYFAGRLGIPPDSLLAPIDAAAIVELESLKVSAMALLDADDWAEAARTAEALLALARQHDAPTFRAAALVVQGEVEEFTGDPERALALYDEAGRVSSTWTQEERVDLTVRIARTHRKLGDLATSADLLDRAVAEFESQANLYPALLARLCLHLSATCTERGDLARARRIGLQAIEHARAADDRRTLASALWAAAPPMAAADPARALSLIRRAGTLYAELGLTVELGRLYATMGDTALRAGDGATARHALDRAQELMGDQVTPSVLSSILLTRAELERQEGNDTDAETLARRVIAVAEGVEPLEQARARRLLGETIGSQDPEAAERELRAAIELFSSAGAQMDAARCFRSLGDLLHGQGRADEALAAYREGLGAVEGAA